MRGVVVRACGLWGGKLIYLERLSTSMAVILSSLPIGSRSVIPKSSPLNTKEAGIEYPKFFYEQYVHNQTCRVLSCVARENNGIICDKPRPNDVKTPTYLRT